MTPRSAARAKAPDARAVCKIVSDEKSRATAWMMGSFQGRQCLMTTNHAVSTVQVAMNSRVVLDIKYPPDHWLSRVKSHVEIGLSPNDLFWSSTELDCSIVALDSDAVGYIIEEDIRTLSYLEPSQKLPGAHDPGSDPDPFEHT